MQHSNLFYLFRPSTTMGWQAVGYEFIDEILQVPLHSSQYQYSTYTNTPSPFFRSLTHTEDASSLTGAAPSPRVPVDTVTHRTQDEHRRRQDLFLPSRSRSLSSASPSSL